MSNNASEVTRLLDQVAAGVPTASEELLPLVYDELRQLARARLARESRAPSEPTSLVHDAYVRLVGNGKDSWQNRAHFFAAAGEAMRRILIEQARGRKRQKRGGGQRPITLDEQLLEGDQPRAEDLLALNQALERLENKDRAMCEVVKLRYFAGLTIAETAEALDLSPRTVNRRWIEARAWLYRELAGESGS
ncbi:MAG: ECF-type sigma factor [Acidobacteriota bacterium]